MEKSIKELLTEVKEGFAAIKQKFASEKKELKFTEATLKDGTIVKTEGELNVGSALSVVMPGGEMEPAPNGTHELEDGTLVTTEAGIVTDIKTPGEVPDVEDMVDNAVAKMKSQLVADYDAKLEAVKNDFTGILEQTFALVEKIAEQPAEEPKGKVEFSKATKEEKFKTVADAIAAFNKK